MNTIINSKHYESFKAKFSLNIEIINGEKITDLPPKNWTSIKTDLTSDDKTNIALLSGKINNFFVVDLDVPKEGEYDGIKYFEEKVCPIKDLKTLVIKSIRGGYHIYYKYNPTLKSKIKLINIDKSYSIDILSDGKMVYEGNGYELVNDGDIEEVPQLLLDLYKKDDKRITFDHKHIDERYSTKGIEYMLNNLSDNYFNVYSDWISVLIVLKNIDCPIKLVLNFSRKSKHYQNDDYIEKIYEKLEKRDSPTIGSLFYYLNQSIGKNRYDAIIKKIKKELIKDGSSSDDKKITDYHAFSIFQDLYKDKVFCNEDNEIFICNKYGIWQNIKSKNKRFHMIIKEFDTYLSLNGYDYSLLEYRKRQEFINEIQIHLQKSEIELNKNKHLFPFTNGVYDFNTMEFRVALPEELITETCGYDYIYQSSIKANEFITDMIPNAENREYLLKVISSHLVDIHKREEFFCLYNKCGNNGKSTLIKILLKVFGDFGYSCKSDILVDSKSNGECASPVIFGMKNKRFITYQEINKNVKLNTTMIKTLTGGDVINARQLYKGVDQFEINGMHMLSCQQPPAFDIIDGAIIRRNRLIEMEVEFVEKVTKHHHRKVKDILPQELVYSMFQLLIEHHIEIMKGIQYCPEKVQEATQRYFEKTNLIKNFCIDYIIKDVDGSTTRKELLNLINQKDIEIEYEFKGQKSMKILDEIMDILNERFIAQKKVNGIKKTNVLIGYKLKNIFDDYVDDSDDKEEDLILDTLEYSNANDV